MSFKFFAVFIFFYFAIGPSPFKHVSLVITFSLHLSFHSCLLPSLHNPPPLTTQSFLSLFFSRIFPTSSTSFPIVIYFLILLFDSHLLLFSFSSSHSFSFFLFFFFFFFFFFLSFFSSFSFPFSYSSNHSTFILLLYFSSIFFPFPSPFPIPTTNPVLSTSSSSFFSSFSFPFSYSSYHSTFIPFLLLLFFFFFFFFFFFCLNVPFSFHNNNVDIFTK
ncbi:unnamed protein product [Acanthosepion pharaonis]|uniref:Uncharacterized protein n=1 Tax=Acanthosepion pharaonis TaxID=158019 RepID=A0A812CBI9_ACAPH|nr:unnamed protein product [Sepia pharaonis]